MNKLIQILSTVSIVFTCSAAIAQSGKQSVKVGKETYYTPDTMLLRGEIAEQRTAESVGIPKILSRIPAKNTEIILENYARDAESLNLKSDIKKYLSAKGYTSIKTNVQPLYGEDFRFRQCDVAIMDAAGSIILFIPPCERAYKH